MNYENSNSKEKIQISWNAPRIDKNNVKQLLCVYITGYKILPDYLKNERNSYWKDVYGFNFKAVHNIVRHRPILGVTLPPNHLTGSDTCILSINLATISSLELNEKIYSTFPFSIILNDEVTDKEYNVLYPKISGFCLYFDFTFFSDGPIDDMVVCNTKAQSHWHHVLFDFPSDVETSEVPVESGDVVFGTVSIEEKNDCKRNQVFKFDYKIYNENYHFESKQSQMVRMTQEFNLC